MSAEENSEKTDKGKAAQQASSPPPLPSPPADDAPAGAPEWMCTFADLMSLLLVFFILLLTYSQIDVAKYRILIGSLRYAFGSKDATGFVEDGAETGGAPIITAPQQEECKSGAEGATTTEEQVKLEMALEDVLSTEDFGIGAELETDARGILVRVAGQAMFAAGSADILPGAKTFLQSLIGTIKSSPCRVMVEGHTDSATISTSAYASNWELSAARAGSIVRFLAEQAGVSADRFMAVGLADTRPVVPNTSEENRAANRRVEIVFLLREGPVLGGAPVKPTPTAAAGEGKAGDSFPSTLADDEFWSDDAAGGSEKAGAEADSGAGEKPPAASDTTP
ncbi:MAG: OmpA family protein [Candidatus Schekmanbacteria bacterium]|nr:OmpA family protein [Candidatus Schekmanbacteria bacterium]